MKIKTSGLKKKPIKSKAYHYWLVEEKPKRKKRLPQLNKANQLMRKRVKPSELVVASKILDNQPKKGKK
jgi:hypothetical protein